MIFKSAASFNTLSKRIESYYKENPSKSIKKLTKEEEIEAQKVIDTACEQYRYQKTADNLEKLIDQCDMKEEFIDHALHFLKQFKK